MTQQEPRQKPPGLAPPHGTNPCPAAGPHHTPHTPRYAPRMPRAAGVHWVMGAEHGTGGLQVWAGAASSWGCRTGAGPFSLPDPAQIPKITVPAASTESRSISRAEEGPRAAAGHSLQFISSDASSQSMNWLQRLEFPMQVPSRQRNSVAAQVVSARGKKPPQSMRQIPHPPHGTHWKGTDTLTLPTQLWAAQSAPNPHLDETWCPHALPGSLSPSPWHNQTWTGL